jgi:hypothetical protein
VERFSVITPTGDRPEAFSICCKLMEQQTQKPSEWIIIDDGNTPLNIPDFGFVKYIKRQKKDGEPKHSLPIQFQTAMGYVTTDKVIIMEDDDWYDKNYFMITNVLLGEFNLVGLTHNIYYFIPSKQYYIFGNNQHSSFCSTAFTREIYRFFNHIKLNQPYIDMDLWRVYSIGKKLLYRPEITKVLGIKGLPGRMGITYDPHRNITRSHLKEDVDLQYFKSIVGDDFILYERFFR